MSKNPEWSQALVAHVAAAIGVTPKHLTTSPHMAEQRGGAMVAIIGEVNISASRAGPMLGLRYHRMPLYYQRKIQREGFTNASFRTYHAAVDWMRANRATIEAEEDARPDRPGRVKPWTAAEVEALKRAVYETPTGADVRAAVPTHGRDAIEKMMRQLGLSIKSAAAAKRARDRGEVPSPPKPAAAPEPAPKPRLSAVRPSNRQLEVQEEMRRREQSRRRLELDGGNLSTMRRAAL